MDSILSSRKYIMNKSLYQLYQEREARFSDAVNLKVPDRIPVMLELSYFPAKYNGIPCSTAFNNYNAWLNAYLKTINDFAPDVVQFLPFFPGLFYDILGARQLKLPGFGIDPNHSQQFIEGEFLKADDYDWLMSDPTDFNLRGFLPKIFKALEPFGSLPPFRHTIATTSCRPWPKPWRLPRSRGL
jgi:hypothetical protein